MTYTSGIQMSLKQKLPISCCNWQVVIFPLRQQCSVGKIVSLLKENNALGLSILSTADLNYVTCQKKHMPVQLTMALQRPKTRTKTKPEINQLFGKILSECIKSFHLDKLFSLMINSQKDHSCLARHGSSECSRQLCDV